MAAALPNMPIQNGMGMHKALSKQKDKSGSQLEKVVSGDGDLASAQLLELERGNLTSTMLTPTADDYGGRGDGKPGKTQKIEQKKESLTIKERSLENGWRDEQGSDKIGAERDDVGDQVHAGLEASRSHLEEKDRVLKLSPARIYELASSPTFLPTPSSLEDLSDSAAEDFSGQARPCGRWTVSEMLERPFLHGDPRELERAKERSHSSAILTPSISATEEDPFTSAQDSSQDPGQRARPYSSSRTVPTPSLNRRLSSSRATGFSRAHVPSSIVQSKAPPLTLRSNDSRAASRLAAIEGPQPSPMPQSIPVPPLSFPTYLQLEMSSQRPSPMYIHRSITSDFPYESSRVKLDRLLNFLFLPPQLEQILWFGALACLDAWLYSFTILPLRFLKALSILGRAWGRNMAKEARYISRFVYAGTGRMWQRRGRRESINGSAGPALGEDSAPADTVVDNQSTTEFAARDKDSDIQSRPGITPKQRNKFTHKHRRTRSLPSALLPDHKADILKGLLIILSCTILMYFDASRMYHGIRGQAAIKLYVIYNVLEVCDRLFSAIGQDVLECLFSKETLERKPDGRSKVWTPFWMFILALCYNLVHSTALFYQVITLNVAVNSYSNALLTLLMSNQFVEIKSTVFKKFEKENLFQLTCADVVERFQLCLMLMIIASRNLIETGGLTLGSSSGSAGGESALASSLRGSTILPKSFTIFPEWTGQVMGPFFLVLGSEMLVDWIKHAYITKFNNIKPAIYGRFLDVLAKDYYSNAFVDQNLTRRLGLPVIPLACLFIRASVQTYHMFLATHMPLPLPSSATSLSAESATASPATTAALQHIDHVFRRALGRSALSAGEHSSSFAWSTDDIIAFFTMLVFFLVLFLALLAFKLVLGMCLLSFARHRYKSMKEREKVSVHAEGRRVGGWGVVEVDEDKRRWIYEDDHEGAIDLRERETAVKEKEARFSREGGESFERVSRYDMINKRIW